MPFMISIYLLPHFPYYPLPFTFVPMARITNPPQGIILSSALGDIILDVEGTYIYVALTNSAHATILRERYYVHDGKVTLCDLASLIEADMRTHRLTLDTYYLELFASTDDYENGNEDDHAILTVLYCDRFTVCNDVPQFLRENFLITLQVQRITPTATASLSYYADKDEGIAYTIDMTYRISGATYSDSFDYNQDRTATVAAIYQVPVPLDIILKTLALSKQTRRADIEIVSLTVTAGQRSATFYVNAVLNSGNAFLFRNCFNILETATFSALTTAKTDVDRSTAIIGGKSEFYNQSTTKSYETTTAPLISDEADWIDQLFTSHEVYRIKDGTQLPVLITDSSCEIQDGDEKLNTVKFTWRFADNRPAVSFSSSLDIFNETYNTVYS